MDVRSPFRLTKEEYENWIQKLRTTEIPQCFGTLAKVKDGKICEVCALGVLGLSLGQEKDIIELINFENEEYYDSPNFPMGLFASNRVWRMNDDLHWSFKQIADWLELPPQFVTFVKDK